VFPCWGGECRSFLPDTFESHTEGGRAALRYLPITLAAAPALALCTVLGLRMVHSRSRLVLLLPLSAALLGPFAARLVVGVSLNPRYFQSAVPAVLVSLAVGASAEGACQLLARAAGVGVGVPFVAATAMHFAPPGHGREEVVGAGAWLDAHVPRDRPGGSG